MLYIAVFVECATCLYRNISLKNNKVSKVNT